MLSLENSATDLPWLERIGLAKQKPFYHTNLGAAFLGDSLAGMKRIPSESIDLVVTSPPFALTRKKEYGNEPIERYLEWFIPFCEEIKRILTPKGSFVLDIGGAWIPGAPVRSTYHFEVAVQLARMFHLAQDFYWYNPARLPTPAEWVTVRRVRVKDAVNTVWWFSKTENPDADNRRVLVPYSESMKSLIKNGYKAKKRPSGHDISEKFGKDNGGAIPPNLLTIANTESNSAYLRLCREFSVKPHPARFPAKLVEFFVDFLVDRDSDPLILDPFGGSNVTGSVAEDRGFRWVTFEQSDEYMRGSMLRFLDGPLFTEPRIRSLISGESTGRK
ncbi:MAG: site-specific DNA-methyltransferase [Phycisphaeraceae bacterium]|nr:site-specific DNA-methyltransferase [Phycisphaeraceae bacterium]